MMFKERRDLRPLLVEFGVAFALSFAGFLYSRLRTRQTKPYLPPRPALRVSDRFSEAGSVGIAQFKDDVQALKISSTSDPEEMYVQQTSMDNASGLSPSIRHRGDGLSPRSDVDTSRTFRRAEKDDCEQEIKHLRNMVRVLRERERNLEVQLLEYYGLKEQETAALELQNQLKINNMEAQLFTLKIESLQSDNQRLESQVADHTKVVAELETARSRIKLLKKKLRHEVEQNREQILNLQKRVARLQEEEVKTPANNQDIESKLQRLQVLESEAEELRKSTRRLQIENSELARKLESTQILANSVLEDPQTEAFREMSNCLRQENEELTKRIEQLQADRCTEVEELVYLRWINACLRHEMRNYQPPPGKTVARDLSKSLSPKSEEKAKKLILEYAQSEGMGDRGLKNLDFDYDQWSSSQTSCGTDSGDLDDSSFDNSPAMKTTNSGKKKFFKKFRRLLLGKDSHHHHQSCQASSSTTKADQPEYADNSPSWSSGINRVTTPSPSSCSTSSDVPRWRSMNVDHIKDVENFHASDHSPLQDKSELVKFAEVLKESGMLRGKVHKKAVSYNL
ncbi:hypothetical protein PTKIN_Ptkin18bG0065100 [Pterospermum kingtungense]